MPNIYIDAKDSKSISNQKDFDYDTRDNCYYLNNMFRDFHQIKHNILYLFHLDFSSFIYKTDNSATLTIPLQCIYGDNFRYGNRLYVYYFNYDGDSLDSIEWNTLSQLTLASSHILSKCCINRNQLAFDISNMILSLYHSGKTSFGIMLAVSPSNMMIQIKNDTLCNITANMRLNLCKSAPNGINAAYDYTTIPTPAAPLVQYIT